MLQKASERGYGSSFPLLDPADPFPDPLPRFTPSCQKICLQPAGHQSVLRGAQVPPRVWPCPVRWMELVGKVGRLAWLKLPCLGPWRPPGPCWGEAGAGQGWLFSTRIVCSAPRGFLCWVAMCRQQGTALPPERCSLAAAAEGGRYPPQKVPNVKIWGSALTLQLVVKGWGTLEARCC